jgi:hypothetical protein
MHEAPLPGNGLNRRHPGKVGSQPADAQLPKLVVQLGLRRRGGQHRLHRAKQRCLDFRQKWLRHRRGAEVHRDLRRQIDDVAFEDGADLQPPLLAARQLGALGDRPEPQRAPVIHHQLEAAVRRGVVVVAIEQAFAADGFLLRA